LSFRKGEKVFFDTMESMICPKRERGGENFHIRGKRKKGGISLSDCPRFPAIKKKERGGSHVMERKRGKRNLTKDWRTDSLSRGEKERKEPHTIRKGKREKRCPVF